MRQHALSVLRLARDKFFASLVFIREWARSPRAMGQVCPSGTPLARSMAACVPLPAPVGPDGLSELVVELGAGTGTVTQELLRRGVHPHRLLVLERSEGMVELLRQRFPGLRVVHGDAAGLARYIPPRVRVTAIVSSLPLVSLPPPTRRAVIAEFHAVLGDGLLIQYTYSWARGFILMREGFRCEASHRVWLNLPPARVMLLRDADSSHPARRD